MPSGHVEKKGKNWYVVLELENEDGERRRRWISAKKELALAKRPTKPQAEKLLEKYLRDLHDGIYVEPTEITVKEYLLQWLGDYAKPNVKPTTYGVYRNTIEKHIIPSLGNIQLSTLRKSKVKGFLAEKQKPGARADGKSGRLSNTTVRGIYAVLKSVLDHAVEDELIRKNPAVGITPPKRENPKVEYWGQPVTKKFLNKLKNEKHKFYSLYFLALATGMRRGEFLGLKWQNVDFKKKTIKIATTYVHTEAGDILQDSTKSGRERTIEVSQKVLEVLQDYRKRQTAEFIALGRPQKDLGLVFTSSKGTPVAPRNLDRQFKRLIEKAKLPKLTIHGLRHTAATRMLEDGIDVKTVADILGHADASVLLNTYSHVTYKMKKQAALSMDSLL